MSQLLIHMVRWSFVYLFLRCRLVSLSLSTGPYSMVINLKLCWSSNPQDLISNSLYCQPYSSCDVSLENLVLAQLIIPQLIFFFILVTCLLDFALILSGEILSWSLMGVKGLTPKSDLHLISPYNITPNQILRSQK